MSALKTSQIHDGFATIRSRGLQRSRSRVEQLERLKPITTKNDSVPIYENPNNLNNNNSKNIINNNNINNSDPSIASADCDHELVYKFESFSGLERSFVSDTIPNKDTILKTIHDLQLDQTPSSACNSFKCSSNNLPNEQVNNAEIHDRPSLPPPSPCYENLSNNIQAPKTPDSLRSSTADYFLYSRPTSPLYEHFIGTGVSSNTDISSRLDTHFSRETYSSSPPRKFFTTSYFRKGNDNSEYALQKIINKTPINFKSQSLQYRKSYSHPSQTIYETTVGDKVDRSVRDYYNLSTNYYDPSEINYTRYSTREQNAISSEMLSTNDNHTMPPNRNAFERRYATLAHPKDMQRFQSRHHQQRKYAPNQFSASQTDVDYLDPLDFKIGCQTTLRSKPQIPWYELAIKNGNRRQSCPPLQAHVVSAFEQSLTNMTQRLQQLSATAERKDDELTEMRQTIELLRKQSIQAGLTSAHIQSMGNELSNNRLSTTNSIESTPSSVVGVASASSVPTTNAASATNLSIHRHLSSDSMCSLNSLSSGCSAQDKKKKTGWLRTSFKKAFSRNTRFSKNNRYVSAATTLEQIPSNHSISLNSTVESATKTLPPPSPTKGSPHRMMPVIENAAPIDAIDGEGNPMVEDLKKQLREKDLVLTDIRLEALSSASQLESLKDTVMKMRQEMMNLKQNNERLQKMVVSRSLAGSEVSLGNGHASPNDEPRRYSLADGNLRPPLELPESLDETEEEDITPAPAPAPNSPLKHDADLSPSNSPINDTNSDHLSTPAEEIPEDHVDGKKISIVVYLGQPESFGKYADELQQTADDYFTSAKISDIHENGFEPKNKSFLMNSNPNEFVIAFTYISGKTTWQNLDYIVRKTFKDYLARIDTGTNLGLNTDSITSYHLGDAKRGPEIGFPELLPCGYIVGNVRSLYICLQGVGSLAFDSLIPRSIVHRYISLLTEHRRLILCGPSGTGKSYLARKLAEFLVNRSQRGNPTEVIATFNVDHKSSKELRQYLGHIAEQASMTNGALELPSVIILDNLHHASALGDVFQVLLSAGPAAKLPCIIGTMSQATCNTTNLQLHHNFRWVLTANHMEPVKGFLARFLRRRLYTLELATHTSQPQLASVFAWLPTVWQHINRFLETHSSSDVTIGPRLFLSCPLDLTDAQVWFTDVWNYHLAPYLVEAVREGVQLYGRRGGAWVDPVTFVRESYPWSLMNDTVSIPPLRQINAEDVGLEGGVTGGLDSQDPLLNMLMRLQEAATYSGNAEQESDCASLDSNITQDSSAGAE